MTDAHSIDAFDRQTNGASRDDALIDCNIAELHYGKFKAVRDVAIKLKKVPLPPLSVLQDAARVRCWDVSTA
jgi:hypothetical protein